MTPIILQIISFESDFHWTDCIQEGSYLSDGGGGRRRGSGGRRREGLFAELVERLH
ncbi:unnamed protein product [Musa acuminata var. zebrina]